MSVSVDEAGQGRLSPAGVVMVMVGKERVCISSSLSLDWVIILRLLLGDAGRILLFGNRRAVSSSSTPVSSLLSVVLVTRLRSNTCTLEKAAPSSISLLVLCRSLPSDSGETRTSEDPRFSPLTSTELRTWKNPRCSGNILILVGEGGGGVKGTGDPESPNVV